MDFQLRVFDRERVGRLGGRPGRVESGRVAERQPERVRQLPRQAAHRQAVAAVGRDGQMEHHIVQAEQTGGVIAGRRRVRRQHQNAGLVDTEMKGFSYGKEDRKMGIRGVPNVPIFLDNVRVPAENMIGPEGKAFKTCMRILDLNRPTIGACAVGLAQGAIDHATAYARERRQFGRAISEFQGIQFMLADMQMQTEAARCMLYDCTRMADREEWDGFSAKASMVKCFASDTAMKVTTDAVQIFGGAG